MRFLIFKNKKIIFSIVFFLISAYFVPNHFIFGQEQCSTKEECEQLLKQYEEQINKYETDIAKTQGEKNTLNNQISILKKQIDKLDLQISQSNLMVKDLTLQVKDTESSIDQTSLKIIDSKSNLADILQSIHEEDQKSLIEILVSEEKLSGFFDNLMNLEVLNSETQKLLGEIKNLKTNLENQKQSLDDEKQDLENLVSIKSLQKQESEATKKQKNTLLKLTEAGYQESLKKKTEAEKRATEIKARIFELIGVPEAPTFGEAYDIAKYVNTVTGIRPALLLAVLTQESNIGKNVGQCYLKNPSTGEGVVALSGKSSSRVMNPSRDVSYFLEITRALGRDPYNTPISCPMSVGWGGAMGPAQFIPSTWANSKSGYDEKVKAVTGKTGDPWNIKDAFLAAGLYLKDLGVMENEFKAVMRYFSGTSWSKWEEFYGNSVLSIARRYEEDIKQIEGI